MHKNTAITSKNGVQVFGPLPSSLSNPAAYEAWRNHQVEVLGTPLTELSARLLGLGDPMAKLRASMLLVNNDRDQARILAEESFREGSGAVRLLRKAQLAILNTLEAWSDKESQRLAVASSLVILEKILEETKSSDSKDELLLEIELRVHAILADGYILAPDLDKAREHAAETQVIAPAVGIGFMALTSKFQFGKVSFAQGKAQEALEHFELVANDPSATKRLLNRAELNKGIVLLSIGDDTAALECFDAHSKADATIKIEDSNHFRNYTLRVATPQPSSTDLHLKKTARAANFSEALSKICTAQELRPEKKRERSNFLIAARDDINAVLKSSQGWGRHSQATWSAYISLLLGDLSTAHTRIPELADLESLPPFNRIFGLCVLIEILERNLPHTTSEMLEAVRKTNHYLADFEPHVLPQVAAKLQLLTPVALAICSRFLKCPDPIVIKSSQAIFNFKHRPITVYGSEGIRPIQAARHILERFDWDVDFLPSDGGSQKKGIEQVLCRKFYDRQVWYRPVSAAELAFALLCMSDVAGNTLERNHLLQSSRDLKRCYGFVPSLQKVKEFEQINQIDKFLCLALENKVVSTSAASLLFGRGSR